MARVRKLNLGCGSRKIPGYVNIDSELACKPDRVWDFVNSQLPYASNSVDEILLFHTIEHVQKIKHLAILNDFWRVLKPDAGLIISYPEFAPCVQNWLDDFRGERKFWEATIFGRQLYPGDFHVCAMETGEFINLLNKAGFHGIFAQPEPDEPYNTIVSAVKGPKPTSYEDIIKLDMESHKFEFIRVTDHEKGTLRRSKPPSL